MRSSTAGAIKLLVENPNHLKQSTVYQFENPQTGETTIIDNTPKKVAYQIENPAGFNTGITLHDIGRKRHFLIESPHANNGTEIILNECDNTRTMGLGLN